MKDPILVFAVSWLAVLVAAACLLAWLAHGDVEDARRCTKLGGVERRYGISSQCVRLRGVEPIDTGEP